MRLLIALALLGAEDSAQTAALRAMQAALKDRNWTLLHEKHCHPNLQAQIDLERFKKFMDGDKGKAIVDLFGEVLKAVDDKADEQTLIARPQEKKDEYEYILVKVQRDPDRKGRQWHLELKLDGGQWKLLDTD